MSNTKTTEFFTETYNAVLMQQWKALSLSKPKNKHQPLQSVTFRPVLTSKKIIAQGTFKMKGKEEVKNFPLEEMSTIAQLLFNESFYNAHLSATTKEGHLLVSSRGFETLKWKQTRAIDLPIVIPAHDHKKNYIIEPDRPFLHALGIANKEGQILKDGQKKYRQINKYLEIFGQLVEPLLQHKHLHVVDMGCGKGYLTFGMYDYLSQRQGLEFDITGIDIKDNVITDGQIRAKNLGFDHLHFINAYISDVDAIKPDILVALHACDTATDDALYYGISQSSKVIVVAPCCQKQVRKSIEGDPLGLYRHGIIEERLASDLTDLIRANILRHFGYQVRIIEFISSEHTAKNLMITAVHTGHTSTEPLDEIKHWMSLFGIKSHYLLDKTGLSAILTAPSE